MENYQNQRGRVNCSNDTQMVNELIRVPKKLIYNFKKTDSEKSAVLTAKSSYSKLKRENIELYKEKQEDLIRAFLKCDLPNFNLVFSGVKI